MSTSSRLEQFRSRYSELRESSRRLSTALRESAQGLVDFGKPASSVLIEDLRKFGNDFRNLRSWSDDSGDSNASSLAPSGSTLSLVDLEREFEARSVIRDAITQLDRIESIESSSGFASSGWEQCLDDCRTSRMELQQRTLKDRPDRARKLLSDEHPFSAILTLVAGEKDLSDERWEQLNDIIEKAYGRELTTAIVRRRLTLSARESLTS